MTGPKKAGRSEPLHAALACFRADRHRPRPQVLACRKTLSVPRLWYILHQQDKEISNGQDRNDPGPC